MSQSKVVLWVAVVLVLVGGFLWWSSSEQSQVPAGGNMPAAQNGQNNGALAPAQNTSDASLNRDLSAVDNQMQGLSADTASADQGLNDQPITQN